MNVANYLVYVPSFEQGLAIKKWVFKEAISSWKGITLASEYCSIRKYQLPQEIKIMVTNFVTDIHRCTTYCSWYSMKLCRGTCPNQAEQIAPATSSCSGSCGLLATGKLPWGPQGYYCSHCQNAKNHYQIHQLCLWKSVFSPGKRKSLHCSILAVSPVSGKFYLNTSNTNNSKIWVHGLVDSSAWLGLTSPYFNLNNHIYSRLTHILL